jgi:hypothetical protein
MIEWVPHAVGFFGVCLPASDGGVEDPAGCVVAAVEALQDRA